MPLERSIRRSLWVLSFGLLDVSPMGREWNCGAFLDFDHFVVCHDLGQVVEEFSVGIKFLAPQNEIEPKEIISQVFRGDTTEEFEPHFHV